MTTPNPIRSQADRADQTRARILEAAVRQFSENGLYTAALEAVAEGVRSTSMAVLEADASAGERFVLSVLNHFDRIHTNPGFQSLMQQEMIRLHRGEVNALSPLVEKVFRPLMKRMQQVLDEGIALGELIAVDPAQFRYASLGANVFYFLSAPLMRMIEGADPLKPAALKLRRTAAIEYLGQTIFIDREHGARVAARVLAATPMPAHGGFMPVAAPRAHKTERD